jgi:tRNA-dihydrouridine synthase A
VQILRVENCTRSHSFCKKDKSKLLNIKGKTFAVAPMMDWTDRHCRFFHRQITRSALLYTEMITARAIKHGDRSKLLYFDEREQPVALQLGGSEPQVLAEAAKIGEDRGYVEINLNVGCPSGKVQEGKFGACLMAEPELVAACVAAMRAAVRIPVTVKCRIGIDDQDDDADLQNFVQIVASTGCNTFIIHARKAWLQGLSPKQNRELPPLNYARVHRLKASLPNLRIILNGGLENIAHGQDNMGELDGIMLGRAAYHTPWVLHEADRAFTGQPALAASRRAVVEAMEDYIGHRLRIGLPLHRITRHMLGLFHGQPGGRIWRQILSTEGCQPGADFSTLRRACDRVLEYERQAAA